MENANLMLLQKQVSTHAQQHYWYKQLASSTPTSTLNTRASL